MSRPELESLVYVSSAVKLLSYDDIEKILQSARRRNEEFNITGVLLYIGGNFMQYLEGPPASLDAVYDIVKLDDRHEGIIQVTRETIEERQFGDWSMAFQTKDSEGFVGAPANRKLIETILKLPAENPKSAQIVLNSFWEQNQFG